MKTIKLGTICNITKTAYEQHYCDRGNSLYSVVNPSGECTRTLHWLHNTESNTILCSESGKVNMFKERVYAACLYKIEIKKEYEKEINNDYFNHS